MIRANITPMIGRGAPAARARTTAQNKMACDLVSWSGLKRAIYEVPTLRMMPFFKRGCRPLDLPSSAPSESAIGRSCSRKDKI